MSAVNTLICQEPRKSVWKERGALTLGEDEALVKTRLVGICGTNTHAWNGNQPFFSYPRVLGHEICREIVGLDKNIQNLKDSRQVVVIPYMVCQQCLACLGGHTNCCEEISVIGVYQGGDFSEYLSVLVTDLSDAQGTDPQAAVLIEPYAINARAVRRVAVAPGEQVLMAGVNPIGLGAAAAAKADDAHVVVADTSPARREHVSSRLRLPAIDPSFEDSDAQLRAQFSGSLA